MGLGESGACFKRLLVGVRQASCPRNSVQSERVGPSAQALQSCELCCSHSRQIIKRGEKRVHFLGMYYFVSKKPTGPNQKPMFFYKEVEFEYVKLSPSKKNGAASSAEAPIICRPESESRWAHTHGSFSRVAGERIWCRFLHDRLLFRSRMAQRVVRKHSRSFCPEFKSRWVRT